MSLYPKEQFAIESCCLGKDPPWQGWKVTRTYVTADARDKDLIRLRSVSSPSWLYRAVDASRRKRKKV